MKKLCAKADLIMPNLTEATLMLDEEYQEGPYTKAYIEELLKRLAAATKTKLIVLTGVYFDNTKLGAATYDVAKNEIRYVLGEKISGSYHGTGDVFGSALIGALMNGKPLDEAVRIAVAFTVRSISWTQKAQTELRYGVNFEANLPSYIQDLGLL